MRPIKFIVPMLVFGLIVFLGFQTLNPVLAATATCEGDALATVKFDTPAVNRYRLNGTGPGLPTAEYFSSDTQPESFAWVLPGPGSWDVSLEWSRGGAWEVSARDSLVRIKCIDKEDGAPAGNLLDGRINNDQSKDVAAPVAVYCADGNIDVYKIDAETGDGTRIMRVAQVEGSPESTQLLASAEGVSLYWLDTGEYHINTTNFEGKPYWINWIGCSSDALTHTLN